MSLKLCFTKLIITERQNKCRHDDSRQVRILRGHVNTRDQTNTTDDSTKAETKTGLKYKLS